MNEVIVMNRTMFAVLGLLVVGLISAGIVSAHYGSGNSAGTANGQGMMAQDRAYEPGTFHEQMEELMEEGTYEDLVTFREETGMNMMPWVDSAEDFGLAQERHAEMEVYREENGIEPGTPLRLADGSGMMKGSGRGGMMRSSGYGPGNCPMSG